MSRKGPAQLQKQMSTPNDNMRTKNTWENNVRQLRHQTSFSGVSYLDVIKERERSDSGFSGDVYEELSNDTSFLKDIPETDGFSTNTSALPISSSSRNIKSRRESYDSGLSVSPSAHTPPQFDIEFDASFSKVEIQDNLEKSGDIVSEQTNATNPPPARRRKKKKRLCGSLSVTQFNDVYRLTGTTLGQGSYGKVEECENIVTKAKLAVKIISKNNVTFSRAKMLKEIELYFLCQGVPEIIQLIEYFEESEFFYLVFEKAKGGPLLNQITRRVHFGEREAASIIRDLAAALSHLHSRGIAHRDVKPENVLCYNDGDKDGDFLPVKLCDFDLCSSVYESITTPKLQSPVGSVEYMAPEVVEAFSVDLDFFGYELQPNTFEDEEDVELTYDKRCDLWSLGIIAYILLCGYLPFSGRCGKDCGWEDRGEECFECQHQLFQSIKSGNLIFPEEHWSGVSEGAKDLITKLLVRDASQRLEASSILSHPWITMNTGNEQTKEEKGTGIVATDLETPQVLRKKSRQEKIFYSAFSSNALAIKRNCIDHHSIATSRKKSMKKSATVAQFHDVVNDAASNYTLGNKTEGASTPINVCQNNNNYEHPSYIESKLREEDDRVASCLAGEGESEHQKILNRQQSCQNYLTYPSPFSTHLKRQTSLVVFATDYEKDMNEKGCRWEF